MVETNTKDIINFIALLIYRGLVKANSFTRYWSTNSLYCGLWARKIMSHDCFKSLLAMLHVVDTFSEDPTKKLWKVDTFIEHFRLKCKNLFQPYQNIVIDEQLVKLKHRFGIREYIAKWEKITVKKPYVIERSNAYVNAVDKSDQMLSKYSLLHKYVWWWKTLFFHIIDISIVNAYVLFREYQKSHPELESIKCSKNYFLINFTKN